MLINCTVPSNTLKMEAASSSKMLLPTYKTIRCHNPEDHNLNTSTLIMGAACYSTTLASNYKTIWCHWPQSEPSDPEKGSNRFFLHSPGIQLEAYTVSQLRRPKTSTLKMEAAGSSKKLISNHKTIRRHNPGDHSRNSSTLRWKKQVPQQHWLTRQHGVTTQKIKIISTPKTQTAGSSSALISTYKTTRCHNPQNHNLKRG
jgi:hypothetical protein